VAGAWPPLAERPALTLLRRCGAAQAAAPGVLGEPRRPHGSNGALRGGPAGAAPRGAPPAAPLAAPPAAAAPKPEVDDSGTDTEDEGELIKRAQAARTALDRYVAPGPARERPAPAPAAAHAGAPAGAGAPAAPAAMPKRRNANAGAPPTRGAELSALRGQSAWVSHGVKPSC